MKIKNIALLLLVSFLSGAAMAQKVEIYNPDADAKKEIKQAVEKANLEGKHVFLQIGGNWCPWCVKFHNFVENDSELKKDVEANYEVVKVNYDPQHKQEELLAELGFPQRFGFPVFVILDGNGIRIHTQNSAYLEKDKSYDKDVVLRFFKNWSAAAVNPASYQK